MMQHHCPRFATVQETGWTDIYSSKSNNTNKYIAKIRKHLQECQSNSSVMDYQQFHGIISPVTILSKGLQPKKQFIMSLNIENF